jgi:hypothetical protein
MFHYIVLNIIYICVCAIFVDIIICVLFVGRGQSISCDNLSQAYYILFRFFGVLFRLQYTLSNLTFQLFDYV